jgi:beta-glucosidase
MELKAFTRIFLNAGEQKSVNFELSPGMFEILNRELTWEPYKGKCRIMIGSSSKDIRLREVIELK